MDAGRPLGVAHVDRPDPRVMMGAAQAAQVEEPFEGVVVVEG